MGQSPSYRLQASLCASASLHALVLVAAKGRAKKAGVP
jgi:hypothetical protein